MNNLANNPDGGWEAMTALEESMRGAKGLLYLLGRAVASPVPDYGPDRATADSVMFLVETVTGDCGLKYNAALKATRADVRRLEEGGEESQLQAAS
ncbi:MAG: hypothetical protein EOP85_20155 [Verrucomicrobiaceae bacterium]|nr:MAG: hypothetical protein EOP85_20155 [Verrucomicrobiaceae bacterium]